MKKRLAALLAATTILGATTAFASNPFDTVDKTSWDYRHISDLVDDGLITKYPASEMHSKRSFTRIELAEMVYEAIQNSKKADINQKADIVELAKHYQKELQAMEETKDAKGLHLKKIIPIQYGSLRIRYITGPIVNDTVQNGTIEAMSKIVGPDVGAKFDTSKEVDKYITDNRLKLAGMLKQKASTLQVGTHEWAKALGAAGALERLNPNNPTEMKQLKKIAKNLPMLWQFNRHSTENQFDTRLRLNVFGVVTPRTKALARIEVKSRWDKPDSTKVHFDRLMLIERLGKVDVVVGRQGVKIGSGLTYNDYFDGVLVSYKKNDTRYTLAHGWPSPFVGQFAKSEVDPPTMGRVLNANDGKLQASYAQITSKFGRAEASVYFMKGNNGIPLNAFGASIDYKKNKVWIGGEYAKLLGTEKLPQPYGLLSSLLDDTYAWTAGVGYGDYNIQKKGSWDVKLRYLFEGRVAPVMDNYTFNQPFIGNYKAWNLAANYAIKKNLSVNLGAFFDGKSIKETEEYNDLYTLAINYNF